ncbi:MAG: TIGR04076 family protein [Promethearchaeota archaeon]
MPRVKVTVIKKYSPEDIFGHEMRRQDGKRIPVCGLEVGEEFIVDSHLKMPEDFCPRVWHDHYGLLMMYFYGGDMEYPAPGVTYTVCGDGVRPVIFKIEPLND